MVDIKNIPAELKTSCRFCVWKFEKRNGQKTKMPYNPANGDRARINDLRTFADFKTTLVTYAMGGYDGIGIAVGSGIGAFDIDHCIREDGTLNDTANTVLSIFPTAYVEKSPSGKGLRGFFHVPEDYVYDKTVYYINNRSKGLEVYMPGATNRFVTVTGDVYRTGEIPNDETAMTTLLDTLMKRNKQVQQTHFQHHSYLDDDAVVAHANEASNSEKFKKLFAGEWEDLYGSQSDADMALLSIPAFWCGCDEEQMDRIFRTSNEPRPVRASHRGHRARQTPPSPSSARRSCCPQCRGSPCRSSHGSDCPPASALAAVHACPRGYLRRHRNRLPTRHTTDAAANPPARAAAPAACCRSE